MFEEFEGPESSSLQSKNPIFYMPWKTFEADFYYILGSRFSKLSTGSNLWRKIPFLENSIPKAFSELSVKLELLKLDDLFSGDETKGSKLSKFWGLNEFLYFSIWLSANGSNKSPVFIADFEIWGSRNKLW